MNANLDWTRHGIRVALVLASALLVFSIVTNLILRKSGLREETVPAILFDPTLEVDYHTRYGLLESDFSASRKERDLGPIVERDLFQQYRTTEDFFVLVDIRLEPLALIYKGHIEQRDGSLIAQVNWGERTYFVRKGEPIGEWRITDISTDQLVVQNAEGETLTLPYLEATYRKERNAVIYDVRAGKEVTARAGETVGGFTVAEIGEESVRFTGKEEFTLRKQGSAIT